MIELSSLHTLDLGNNITAYYRPNSSDIRTIHEVIDQRIYRRKKIDFDVEKGEHWLDLGANIGAFALQCRLRGATAECFEPEPECFSILKMNAPDFVCHDVAVTNQDVNEIPFFNGPGAGIHSRGTAYPLKRLKQHPNGTLPNVHGRALSLYGDSFHGIKMDIEGAEGGLLDDHLLPRCEKLVMEYHTTRDASVENLARRIQYLRSQFRTVSYPPELDRIIAAGCNPNPNIVGLTFFDRMIFCIGAK